MKRRGIVTPPITVTDMVTKNLKEIYHLNLDRLEKEILKNLENFNVEHNKSVLVKDSLEGLIAYLERMGKESVFVKKVLGNIEVLINAETDIKSYEKLKKRMKFQFGKASDHFFKDLFEDADDNLVTKLIQYKLNKSDVFDSRIDNLKELYIDNALERIIGEQNSLKKRFLERLTSWVTGEDEKIDVKDVIKEMKKTSVSEARFFARDQFSKFNKALLISSFKNAGVKRVMLHTCKDAAVRITHRAWENKVFDIDNIPLAWWTDYNCRCGASPVWD